MRSWYTKKGSIVTRVISNKGNVFLVDYRGKKILVDSGHKSMNSILLKTLKDLQVDKLDGLVLTHAHYDHTGNANTIFNRYGCDVFVHKNEVNLIARGINAKGKGTTPAMRLMMFLYGALHLKKMQLDPVNPSIHVDNIYKIKNFGPNTYLMHTPGHSDGSLSFIVDGEIAIVGDILFGASKTSVFPILASDLAMVKWSWKKLLNSGCSFFLPGHGDLIERSKIQKELQG
ncbi:MAG: MBL fold metallo-hydrolase [Thermoplasmatales archaeon]|nr:MAG: MBL fold metallo-hydrolase [Thermoplasmatales archaeon]